VKNVSRLFVAASVILSASFAAQAADLPQPPPPQAPATYIPTPVPVYNWSGIYVGLNGGWGLGTINWTVAGGAANTTSPDGGVFGGTLGFNYQMNAFVFGVEGDSDWSRISGSAATAVCVTSGNCQTGNTWLSTLRGRVGFAMDRVLFYGTGGGVFGNVQTTINGTQTTHTQVGWSAGLGIEAALAENWTAKVEYIYAGLGTANVACTTACVGSPTTIAVNMNDQLIRGGINYKFNF
jgi:outer membrane immunogenic protein